jgi:thiamine pyrophosphate-dependent acetolactate synthase large subunit-like protein
MIIVGPGVLRDGAAADVSDFVTRTGAGVMTTMGAIGVVPFDHPSWCGVVGIQVDDPALGGLDACELVIAVGVDDEELGESLPMNAQLLEVEPWHLPFLATDWPAIESIAAPSSLVEACAAVFGDHREATGSPLHPVRAVLDVFDAIDPDVQVYVDSGPAGFWFARGVVPVPIGRVVVPARAADGFAISAAIVSALDGTRSVAITMPGSSLENELLDLAASLDLGIVVEQWGDDVDGGDPSQHRANLVAAMSDSGLSVTGVSVDLAAAAELVDLAGPVVAWPTFN